MKNASYTVEAVFVCSICIWVLLALMYGSFTIHDRMILGSLTNELTEERFQRGDQSLSGEWEKEVKQRLSDHLFLMQVQSVNAREDLASVKVKVQYRLPISVGGIKALFSGGEKSDTYVTTKEITKPMEYKWDADLLREK